GTGLAARKAQTLDAPARLKTDPIASYDLEEGITRVACSTSASRRRRRNFIQPGRLRRRSFRSTPVGRGTAAIHRPPLPHRGQLRKNSQPVWSVPAQFGSMMTVIDDSKPE